MNNKTLKVYVNLSLFVALSLAISLIESMVPMPVPIPGARLGFSNIIILVAIYIYDYKKQEVRSDPQVLQALSEAPAVRYFSDR